eukprot:SAG31_NODE_5754_length_2343_cov_2.869430_3_plen_198_part_00
MVAEALAASDGNFTRATELISSCSVATHTGSIGQAIAVATPMQFRNLSDNYYYSDGLNTSFTQSKFAIPRPPYQPSWPEFFDGATFNRTVSNHPGFLPDGPSGGMFGNYYWPTTERSIANVGAAFPEAIIRTLFGYQPAWHQPAVEKSEAAKAVTAQLLQSDVGRPFQGSLSNLRTAYGIVELQASSEGVVVKMNMH